ncbi:nucleotidyltransferase domain-containing protein [Serratia sp. TSA_7]|uniref:nucleotidyltransferase domain-containing protein n=1 Tax=Serratia sp. TSA_7 TaxID=3415659 RepID=UPI004046D04E
MAVDRNGYIIQQKCSELQPTFSRLVAHLVTKLSLCFPELIHSLYVYGSIAEGRAKIGKSDLDVSINGEQVSRSRQLNKITAKRISYSNILT